MARKKAAIKKNPAQEPETETDFQDQDGDDIDVCEPDEADEASLAELEAALEADISARKSFLSREEETVLIAAYKDNHDSRAYEKLWQNHQGWLRNIVSKENSKAPQIDFDDLMQEAAMGFMKGIEKFDPDRGFRLMTYAQWWVRQQVQRYVSVNRTTQKTPVIFPPKYQDAAKRYFELRKEFEEAGKEWPPKDGSVQMPFKEETGIDFYELMAALSSYYNQTSSLDAPLKEGENENSSSGLDVMEDTTTPTAFATVAQNAEREVIYRAMQSCMTEREQDVVMRRRGLVDGVEQTLEEIGEDYGVTRERIRQIQVKAEKKLVKAIVNGSRAVANDYGYKPEAAPAPKN